MRGEPITTTVCTGAALAPLIPDIAALRVSVFRAFPYLYEGDPAYEADYLRIYMASAGAAVIVARRGGRMVGASTCIPLADETGNIQAPFRARGWRPEDFFYFGESVLLPECRGQGVGVAFFQAREAHARAVSTANHAAFCAVQRPPDHPARPPGYIPLDDFWRRRGYTQYPDLACEMAWREVGQAAESPHRLNFWLKSLHGAPLP